MGIAGRFFMLLSPTSPLLHHRSLIRLSRRRLQIPLHYHRLGFHPRSLGPPIRPKPSPFPPLNPSHHQAQRCHLHTQSTNSAPWPEFSSLLNNLSAAGYFKSDLCFTPEEFAPAASQLPKDFLRAATACLAFARDKAESLGLLSRNDIEVLVQNGMPFLFQNAEQSSRRMRLYLESGGNNVSEADKADMVDLMKFVLSYACNIVAFTEISNPSENVVVESSVRNLLSELGKLHFSPLPSNPSVPVQTPFSHKYGQTQRPLGRQNVEMKRGDWICARCNFMNFARNVKCLECEEARPKRQLNGGEWECPQCDFYNYARNTVCLRCDCNRPGGISHSSGSTTDVQRGLTYGTGSMTDKAGMDIRLAANNEKAQRWFSKVSQLDGTSDMRSVATDEDFPEIMPLRKGINRFVVSTRKTPLERRLANAEHQRSMRNDGNPNSLRTEGANKTQNISTDDYSIASNAGGRMEAISGNEYSKPSNQLSGYERVDGVTEPTSSVSDDDFPETMMPMRKGENKFVVSRKTHRSLASPMYQKRAAMERADDKNHIPFVPLPPDYFAKKETDLSFEANDGNSTQNDIHTQANSLEGSAVKEADILDMSEEAKAERWFKRVAQIKDISELSQIPDEDFPSIMPMRKGVNRFVVSKRKTPLERRLTSQKYRRDLPDPMTTNKEGNNS